MEAGKISISPNAAATIFHGKTLLDKLNEELECIHRATEVIDGTVKINTKDEQKRILGHSPDLADALMLRMYAALKPQIFSFN